MSIYHRSGAAVLECECGHQEQVEWERGDAPIYIKEHCEGKVIRQVTHNDGKTPLSERCPSYCCPPAGHPGRPGTDDHR